MSSPMQHLMIVLLMLWSSSGGGLSQTTASSLRPNRCTYSFSVADVSHQCDRQEAVNTRLEKQLDTLHTQVASQTQLVASLQAQVASLVEQNGRLLSHVDIGGEDSDEQEPKGSAPQPSSVYVHWGRTVCPQGASLVYTGRAGGSSYHLDSGMSDILCLPEKPEWNKYVDGFQGSSSVIHGAEYQTTQRGAYAHDAFFNLKNAGGRSLMDDDVPCAVCHVTGRGSVMTFPALKTCPPHWHLEYQGYLMSEGSNTHHKSHKMSLCMDESPEVVMGGEANKDGAILYVVEAKCGSLPCPNYVDGRELTCAVCTR